MSTWHRISTLPKLNTFTDEGFIEAHLPFGPAMPTDDYAGWFYAGDPISDNDRFICRVNIEDGSPRVTSFRELAIDDLISKGLLKLPHEAAPAEIEIYFSGSLLPCNARVILPYTLYGRGAPDSEGFILSEVIGSHLTPIHSIELEEGPYPFIDAFSDGLIFTLSENEHRSTIVKVTDVESNKSTSFCPQVPKSITNL